MNREWGVRLFSSEEEKGKIRRQTEKEATFASLKVQNMEGAEGSSVTTFHAGRSHRSKHPVFPHQAMVPQTCVRGSVQPFSHTWTADLKKELFPSC